MLFLIVLCILFAFFSLLFKVVNTTLFFLGNVVSIRYMFYICVQQRNKIFDSFALIASIHFTKYKHV